MRVFNHKSEKCPSCGKRAIGKDTIRTSWDEINQRVIRKCRFCDYGWDRPEVKDA